MVNGLEYGRLTFFFYVFSSVVAAALAGHTLNYMLMCANMLYVEHQLNCQQHKLFLNPS